MSASNLPAAPKMSADRLTSQLYHLPAIVGRLGLSIANAQEALNADYTESVKEMVELIRSILKNAGPNSAETIQTLLKQLAPSRYQFTETTLDFSADLAESVDFAGSAALGAGFGAVVINAGVSVGFARDYRAAARVKTILNAIPADSTLTERLFSRADKLIDHGVTLPPRTEVSAAIHNNLRDVVQMTGGPDLPKVAPALPATPLQRAEAAAAEARHYRESAASGAERARIAAASAATSAAQVAKLKTAADAEGDKAKLAELAVDAKAAANESSVQAVAAMTASSEASNASAAATSARAAAEAAKVEAGTDAAAGKAADSAKVHATAAAEWATKASTSSAEARDSADAALTDAEFIIKKAS